MEFVVPDVDTNEYVTSIDYFDGSVEYTSDPNLARIYRGREWADFWGRILRFRLCTMEVSS